MPTALKERKTVISDSELAERVAVIKRFKELLVQQRERFRSYLTVLDKQQQLIIGIDSADEIVAHVELEEQIVADIFSIQKVIDPMEVMYNNVSSYLPANDVPELKATLEDLKNQAAVRSRRNRDLISSRMKEINKDIQAIKNNPFFSKARFSLYQNTAPSLVDIMG
jgi:hypothetical protein